VPVSRHTARANHLVSHGVSSRHGSAHDIVGEQAASSRSHSFHLCVEARCGGREALPSYAVSARTAGRSLSEHQRAAASEPKAHGFGPVLVRPSTLSGMHHPGKHALLSARAAQWGTSGTSAGVCLSACPQRSSGSVSLFSAIPSTGFVASATFCSDGCEQPSVEFCAPCRRQAH
jgi:hypothetical protein